VYNFLKIFKIPFLKPFCAHVKYKYFQLFNTFFHILLDRYLPTHFPKNLSVSLSSVEMFSFLGLWKSKISYLTIKVSKAAPLQVYFKKSVDNLWNFLCIPVGYLKNPQKWPNDPLLNPQFVHMIKSFDYKCLGVL